MQQQNNRAASSKTTFAFPEDFAPARLTSNRNTSQFKIPRNRNKIRYIPNSNRNKKFPKRTPALPIPFLMVAIAIKNRIPAMNSDRRFLGCFGEPLSTCDLRISRLF